MDNIVSFLAASVLLTLAPGPDIIYVITQSTSNGKWAGIYTALGLCTGLIVHTTLIALGVSVLIIESQTALQLLKYAGAAYLFYLAYLSFKEKEEIVISENTVSKEKIKLYKQGILMNLLNPKVILFFLAFLPQFVIKNDIDMRIQLAALGLIFILQALIVFSSVSFFAEYFRNQIKSNIFFTKYIGTIKGTIFLLIGIKMIF